MQFPGKSDIIPKGIPDWLQSISEWSKVRVQHVESAHERSSPLCTKRSRSSRAPCRRVKSSALQSDGGRLWCHVVPGHLTVDGSIRGGTRTGSKKSPDSAQKLGPARHLRGCSVLLSYTATVSTCLGWSGGPKDHGRSKDETLH